MICRDRYMFMVHQTLSWQTLTQCLSAIWKTSNILHVVEGICYANMECRIGLHTEPIVSVVLCVQVFRVGPTQPQRIDQSQVLRTPSSLKQSFIVQWSSGLCCFNLAVEVGSILVPHGNCPNRACSFFLDLHTTVF